MIIDIFKHLYITENNFTIIIRNPEQYNNIKNIKVYNIF